MKHHPGRAAAVILFLVTGFVVALAPSPARALGPDELVLIVNSKSPESRALAEFYAKERKVPEGRILELELPFPREEMPIGIYDADVKPKVRDFLRKNGLDQKVTCLVTFYGVPLRLSGKTLSPAEKMELADIGKELEAARSQTESTARSAEKLATQLDPRFKPGTGTEAEDLAKRVDRSLGVIASRVPLIRDPMARAQVVTQFTFILERLVGTAETLERLSQPQAANLVVKPVTPQQLEGSRKRFAQTQREYADAVARADTDPHARARMRELVRENLGLFRYSALLKSQEQNFKTEQTESAFDSELALLWWDSYPRHRWQINALNWQFTKAAPSLPPVTMVMRLDGPSEKTVRAMIATGVKVEAEGLKGRVAVDARGLPSSDPYGAYDQTLRNLAEIVQRKTKLELTVDKSPTVFAPGSVEDVAIYCGWYSLRKYVPGFKFNPGAVGFHVASSELVTLRSPTDTGWVQGLLKDGVVASLGPVAEPFLQAFPPADQFFPLLFTGELTLAEVYWKTVPMTSWMMTCVGDPLYRPYKTNPALKRDDLREPLKAAFLPPPPRSTTRPSVLPTTPSVLTP